MLFRSSDNRIILDFTQADKLMDWIVNYNNTVSENRIGVRGHVLVWHSQTPDWYFKADVNDSKSIEDGAILASKEVMQERMENYIEDVLAHYGEGTKYENVIYAWDVVNEVINLSDGKENGMRNSYYYQIYGDESYITDAFVFANKYATENTKLYYNDYGETEPVKRDAILSLLDEILNTKDARIDGMGMQAHYKMEMPSVAEFKEAITKYAEKVSEVQITELDEKK